MKSKANFEAHIVFAMTDAGWRKGKPNDLDLNGLPLATIEEPAHPTERGACDTPVRQVRLMVSAQPKTALSLA